MTRRQSTLTLARSCASAFSVCFVVACGIAPYEPPDGKLLQEAPADFRVTRLYDAQGRFFVVETWQGSDPRNKVCTFETLADAEEFYRRSVEDLPLPCEVFPYRPEGGTLVTEEGDSTYQLRTFAVADGFRLVETQPDAHCHCGNRGAAHEGGDFDVKIIERSYGNHVCAFETAAEAARFQERLWRSQGRFDEHHRWKSGAKDATLDLDFERLCSRAPALPDEMLARP